MDKRLLIDGDGCGVYNPGWAGCKRFYLYRGKEYQYKKEIPKEAVEDEIQKVVIPEELRNTLSNVRMAIDSILEACAPISSFAIYLTGKDNFRDKIATIQPYKGNRSPDSKPPHYKEIREYLQEHYNAEVVDGIEADDKIAIEFCKDPKNSVVVGEDKDYLQIPNLRMYNPKKRKTTTVSLLESYKNFYTQLLTGDSTDHIKGIDGVGPKTAEKLLTNQICPINMERICYTEYKKVYGEKAWDYMCENAKLLYLLRSENDTWKPRIEK